jgi:hypothetical protein
MHHSNLRCTALALAMGLSVLALALPAHAQ